MRTILCFGDSNTWGFIPGTWQRYPRDQRWPGILQNHLGPTYHVIEEGLNARTTVMDDPSKIGKNGLTYLRPCLDTHAPIDLVVLMLGTNDLKHRFGLSAFDVAANVGFLLSVIQQSGTGPRGAGPGIFLVAPPLIGPLPPGHFAEMFAGAPEKSADLAQHYRAVAETGRCHFANAAEWVRVSPVDGIHLDGPGHQTMGEKLAVEVNRCFAE